MLILIETKTTESVKKLICKIVCVCRCSGCNAQGTKECKTCKGKRRLLAYIQVKVEW